MPHRFRLELQRIQRGTEKLEVVDIDNPASHGWLRRPDLDTDGVQAWEQPDGQVRGVRLKKILLRR